MLYVAKHGNLFGMFDTISPSQFISSISPLVAMLENLLKWPETFQKFSNRRPRTIFGHIFPQSIWQQWPESRLQSLSITQSATQVVETMQANK